MKEKNVINFYKIVNLLHGDFSRLSLEEIENSVSDATEKYLPQESNIGNATGWVYKAAFRKLLKIATKLDRVVSLSPADIDFIQEKDYEIISRANGNSFDEPDFQLKDYILGQVGEENAQIIFMRAEEYTFQEIGEELKMKKDTVKQRFKRCCAKLRKLLPPP